ncbi:MULTISPECIES: tyrosine-type recombinase/integrase [unclassified Mesorhizobium]|uniref:tyrosine-type recombinase/integrase n=1 Tax=unclassified Mesorhizobium TaxID=325217 RepID=UPI001FE018AB|nr:MULTISPECIES: tyrosine-type recombinase/integrase [unclassified Mesorhizobium]
MATTSAFCPSSRARSRPATASATKNRRAASPDCSIVGGDRGRAKGPPHAAGRGTVAPWHPTRRRQFRGRPGRRSPLQPRSLTHEWIRVIGNTTLPRIRFHDLRHTHATQMLSAGVHPKVASERLGHSTIGITLDLYSHVMPGMQADAAEAVDAAIRSAVKPGS